MPPTAGGEGASGQLGNKSTAGSLLPVAVYTGGVLNGVTLTQISSGTDFALALHSTGAACGWGLNTSGQLGNNSTTSSDVPVSGQALLALNFPAPPSGQISVPYSDTLTASGGTTPYAWSLSTGSLPAGLAWARRAGWWPARRRWRGRSRSRFR